MNQNTTPITQDKSIPPGALTLLGLARATSLCQRAMLCSVTLCHPVGDSLLSVRILCFGWWLSSKLDIHNTAYRYGKYVGEVTDWNTSKSNKQCILEFLRRSDIENISTVRRLKYVQVFKWFLGVCVKDFIERIIRIQNMLFRLKQLFLNY
jgi:hypothetical protein